MKERTRKEWVHAALIGGCAIVLGVLLIRLIYLMTQMTILPVLYAVGIVLLILIVFVAGGFLLAGKKTYLKVIGAVLIIASLGAGIEGVYLYTNSLKALKVIANQTTETTTYGIYVLNDSKVQTVEDLVGDTVGVSTDIEDEELNNILEENHFETEAYDSQLALVEGLINEKCDGAVLNTSYVDILNDSELGEDFAADLRLVEQVSVAKTVEAPNPITPEEPFVVYISGKDTWGHISVTSRSDVNIIAAVNPKTKHILLVSTPRDYYVPLSISNGVKDKLTHAGIYGMDVSKDTMEMLYGIEMDHYFKVNYSGFEGLIDAMGGITVWSDYAFDVENIGHFYKGDNHLTGLQALAFVRERHSFARGDVQRGQNQMNVIQSVVEKMSSKKTLMNYSKILKECDGTFATDISTKEFSDLVAYELANPGEWNIEKLSVGGTGEYNHVYSLKKSVYVMEPNEDDINNAKERIKEVLDEM